jgi:ubiquinone/menaquinone biosynthesis C-methylase UbiE
MSKLRFAGNHVCPIGNCPCPAPHRDVGEAIGAPPFGDRVFAVSHCESCDLGFTQPVPTEETAHLLYSDRTSLDFQPDDTSLTARLKAFAARRDIRALCRGFTLPPAPACLDYGCGNAAFADAIQQVYPSATVIGADEDRDPPQGFAPGQYLSYDALRTSGKRFDMILCRHVLEHTYHPVDAVRELASLLKPGGFLMIEVPSFSTIWRRVFGKYWHNYYAPFHTFHFTRSSLRKVVESAGLKVVKEGSAEMPKMGRCLQEMLGAEYSVGLFALGMALQPVQVLGGLLSGTSVCLRLWASTYR